MTKANQRIPAEDRGCFELMARFAFCNPFTSERSRLYEQLVGRAVSAQADDDLEDLRRVVEDRLRRLQRLHLAHLDRYHGEDRQLMEIVFLFQVYHQFYQDMDKLVEAQEYSGDQLVRVPFASQVMRLLHEYGFSQRAAGRFFAIFYQLRRAHHFIVRRLKGDSPCMGEFRGRLWNNVFTHDLRVYESHLWNRMEDFSTLLLGETGTGKGAAAAAIGRSGFIPFDEKKLQFSESFTRSFVSLNLSQYPETLIESELFGHRKGAFTGAMDSHSGLLARCSAHGSVFLDEIGDVSVPIQIKLLQVLQERRFTPVGSHEAKPFRGRVIAATNRPVDALRGRGLFRDDFFYRLCSDIIHVPTLRQRIEETPHELDVLTGHCVQRLVGAPNENLTGMVLQSLRQSPGADYGWPGNVRELEQAVRRILLTQRYETARVQARADSNPTWLHKAEAGTLDADALLSGYCRFLYDKEGTYEAVARITKLDRRTVKKYLAH